MVSLNYHTEDLGFSEYRKAPVKGNSLLWRDSEKHIPGYNFCGPGTQVRERLERGDLGVNELDNACRLHDVEYMMYSGDAELLRRSDVKLASEADRLRNAVEHEKGVLRRMGGGSRLANFLLEKTGLATVGDFVLGGFKGQSSAGVALAAGIVASVFKGKGFLEDLGIVDPVSFASGLNGDKSPQQVAAEGRELFGKYF